MSRLLAILVVAAALAAGEAQTVPRPLAELLARVAAAEPAEAVRLVDGWDGEPHALLLLARGQARWRLEQRVPAEADFRAALERDPGLRQAHLGLAQCAAAREDWAAASRSAASGIDAANADAAQLAFLAGLALRAEDWRLATLAAQQGILRFPDDERLRRAELTVLVHAGRAEDARQAVLALLGRAPADAALWRHLAWSEQQLGHDEASLAALEAALLLQPADRALRLQLVQAQLARGLAQAALLSVRPLMAQTADDPAVAVLASRAAADGGELQLARAWLDAVPEARRTRDLRLQQARLALQAGDQAAAGAALDLLIQAGESAPAVLTWAASLCEAREPARAEALYLRAATPSAHLRLVAMYVRQQRRNEAGIMLASYLAEHPLDVQARALQAQLLPSR